MNKIITLTILLLTLLFSEKIYAGGSFDYYYYTQNYYDIMTNNLYTSIYEFESSGIINKTEKVNARIITNYLIYNINDKTSKFLFTKNSEHISLLLFENDFDKIKNNIVFNVKKKYSDENSDLSFIINNSNLILRPTKNKILIITTNRDDKKETIWICDKTASNISKITALNENDSWHLDLKNNKIRIIRQKGLNSSVEEYEW